MFEYAKYEPLPMSSEEKKNQDRISKEKNEEYRQKINRIVQEHDLIKLRCDYFGMSSFYYDRKTRTLYEVNDVLSQSKFCSGGNEIFRVSHDQHILRLNNL